MLAILLWQYQSVNVADICLPLLFDFGTILEQHAR